MTRLRADCLLFLAAFIWGSGFVAQSLGMKSLPPLAFTGIRFLLGTLLIVPFILSDLQKLRLLNKILSVRDYKNIGVLGVFLLCGALFQQIGIQTTTVTNAGFLTALYVPLVPIFARILFKEKSHWITFPCAAGCFFGTYLLSGATHFSLNGGDFLIIIGSLFWGLHVLFVGRTVARIPASFVVAGGQFLICGCGALILSFAFESFTLAQIKEGFLPLAYTGFLSVGVAFTLQVVAQRYTKASDTAIIVSAETLFAAIFGYLLLDERLSITQIAGCALIFACILAVQLLPLMAKAKRRIEGRNQRKKTVC